MEAGGLTNYYQAFQQNAGGICISSCCPGSYTVTVGGGEQLVLEDKEDLDMAGVGSGGNTGPNIINCNQMAVVVVVVVVQVLKMVIWWF